jgi:hypothetical protein
MPSDVLSLPAALSVFFPRAVPQNRTIGVTVARNRCMTVGSAPMCGRSGFSCGRVMRNCNRTS